MTDVNEVKKIFGLTVKELRTEEHLSQDALAEIIGLQPDSISTIERGKSFVSCEVLVNLCNHFKVSPTIFFTPKVRIKTEDRDTCIKDIKELLSSCDDKTLDHIRKILIVLQNK